MQRLIISAKRKDFRGDNPHPSKSNVDFNNIRPLILNKHDFTCQYCLFRSKKFQHIHHLDDDHDNNSEDNLVTICPLCHMSQHIGFAGIKGMGTIIYLDQDTCGDFVTKITQEKLNNLVRLLWVRQDGGDKTASIQATDYLKRLEQTRVDADRLIGTCDPIQLGNALRDLSEEHYEGRAKTLGKVFFLPFKEGFEREHEYWMSENYSKVKNQNWSKISENNMFDWVAISNLSRTFEGIKRFLVAKKVY